VDAGNVFVGRERHLQQLSAAVDVADGRAFVTDYAGPSQEVQTWGLLGGGWDETAFIGVSGFTAIDLIAMQGLNTHPLIQSLLLQFIPPPDGMDAQDFWNNLEQYADLVDLGAWDSVAFADALAERIIEPGMHAVDLLDSWPYLTRLQTVISPHEMTVDPIFIPLPDLGEVSNVLIADGLDLCGEIGSIYAVPWNDESKDVCVDEIGQWPALLSTHPALRIEQLAPMGPPQVKDDFSSEILGGWMTHQAEQGCAGPGPGDTGDGDGDGGGDGTTDGGQGESGDAGVNDGADKASCACSTDPARESGAPLGLALALLGLLARRRTSARTRAGRVRAPNGD
jgi:MYXO-CTERM domain-containing protein